MDQDPEELEVQQEVRELQEELSRLRSLVQHTGYKYLMEIADQQILTRREGIILKPLKTRDEVLEQEYAKGEVHGIMLFKEMVAIRIGSLEEEIYDRLKEEKGDEEDVSNTAGG